ncbi:MAG: DNA phosphorothioation-dependent restriction protein DptF [Peptostreptococcaceae bacterium]
MRDNKCLIDILNKLKQSSKEAVENTNNFSTFKSYMHVKRNVEDELLNIIDNSYMSINSRLILVCGGVGDGKSHIISYLKNKYSSTMSGFDIHNDATESFDPSKTSIDTLNDVLSDFNDYNIEKSNKKLILAINLGALSNFIDSKYNHNFTKLIKYVEEKNLLNTDISDNDYNKNSHFQFINFSDYHIYSLNNEKTESKYIDDLINKITQTDKQNEFKNSYNENCLKCSVSYSCPIKINYEMLMISSVRKSLIDIIIQAVINDKLIVSTRSLLNYIYDFIVTTELDNKNKNELEIYIAKMNSLDFLDSIFVSNIFSYKDLSQISHSVSNLDPINYSSKGLDNLIIKLTLTDDICSIFSKYLNYNKDDKLGNIINNNNFIKDELIKLDTNISKVNFKNKLVNLFIRLLKFLPKEEVDLNDKDYIKYIEYLYYFNKGDKKGLFELYKDVREAIYKWDGEVTDNRINILVGKNQTKYQMTQKVDILADLSNLKINDNLDLLKFNPSLVLSYKNEDSTKSYSVDIDFNLYKFLMKVKNGYRPSIDDKCDHINFVKFLDKIKKLGTQNKEVHIEDRDSNKNNVYKLVYSEGFGQFEFMKI